jgi:hypothetical protein
MKKILSISIIVMSIFLMSCADKYQPEVINTGVNARASFESTNSFVDFANIAGAKLIINITSTNPAGIKEYKVKGVFYDDSEANAFNDTIVLKTVTAFPAKVEITSQDLATAFKVPVSYFQAGDRFDIFFEAVSTNGYIVNRSTLSPAILGSNNTTLFTSTLSAYVACPSTLKLGEYNLDIEATSVFYTINPYIENGSKAILSFLGPQPFRYRFDNWDGNAYADPDIIGDPAFTGTKKVSILDDICASKGESTGTILFTSPTGGYGTHRGVAKVSDNTYNTTTKVITITSVNDFNPITVKSTFTPKP